MNFIDLMKDVDRLQERFDELPFVIESLSFYVDSELSEDRPRACYISFFLTYFRGLYRNQQNALSSLREKINNIKDLIN